MTATLTPPSAQGTREVAAVTCRWGVTPAVPILRMHDVDAARRFYVDYLGCSVDWRDGEGDHPVYMQVSRGTLVLHLSSHHGDGTAGAAVLIEIRGLDDLHAELVPRKRGRLTRLRRPGGASRRCRRRRYNSGIGASSALRGIRLDTGSRQGTSFPRH